MHPVKERIQALLTQAKGTRWDVVATRVCGILSVTAGLAPYTGLIPGRTGAIVAGVTGGAAALLPRATKAAGLLQAAYGQQTPFLKILPHLVQTLLMAPKITADAKAQADAQAAAQKAQENAALIRAAVDEIEAKFKSGMFTPGSGPNNLSRAVPPEVKQAALVETEQAAPGAALSADITVADKAPETVADKAPEGEAQ